MEAKASQSPISTEPLIAELSDPRESPRSRYRRIFVGSSSNIALFRYEVITGLLGSLPGAIGYLLRSHCYRMLLQHLGPDSMIGRGLVLRSPGRISIGSHVMIDDYSVLDAKGASSQIQLGNRILLGRNCILSCNEARIRIADYVSIGPFCFFASKSQIDVHANVAIGSGTHLLAATHETSNPHKAVIHQARFSQGIVVEENVWIGSGAKILDGVTIGRNSIVGAGAVVTRSVPAYSTVLGNPARVVEKREQAHNP